MAIVQAKRPPPRKTTAAPASAKPSTQSPPPTGHNKPPEPGSIEAFRDRYGDIKKVAGEWLELKEVKSQEEADDLEAFRKQVRAFKRDAEVERKNVEAPIKKQLAEVKKKWEPVATSADLILAMLEPMVRAWLQKEKARIADAKAEADRKAQEAAEEAERVARRAENNPHSIDAMDAVAEAAEAAEAAERIAKAAAGKKASVGGHVSVGGIKRSGYLKETEKLRVVYATVAMRFLVFEQGDTDVAEFFVEATEKAARAFRKANPDTPIPGTELYMEAKAI